MPIHVRYQGFSREHGLGVLRGEGCLNFEQDSWEITCEKKLGNNLVDFGGKSIPGVGEEHVHILEQKSVLMWLHMGERRKVQEEKLENIQGQGQNEQILMGHCINFSFYFGSFTNSGYLCNMQIFSYAAQCNCQRNWEWPLSLEGASLFAQTVENLPANAGDQGSVSGSERSPGEGNGYSLWYSCLENPMDR